MFEGLIVLCSLRKRSESCESKKNSNELKRFRSNAKHILLAGVFLTLLIVSIVVGMYFLYFKFQHLVDESNKLIVKSAKNLTNSSSSESLSNHFLKHKLHFEIKTDSFNLTTTKEEESAANTILKIITKKKDDLFKTAETTSTPPLSSDRNLYFDKLSILIDHDLFSLLKTKYKILHESVSLAKNDDLF